MKTANRAAKCGAIFLRIYAIRLGLDSLEFGQPADKLELIFAGRFVFVAGVLKVLKELFSEVFTLHCSS